MGRKIKNRRQIHCAEALRIVKKLRNEKNCYDPRVLKLACRAYFIKNATELSLTITMLDGLVGGVMGMLAREDKERRQIKDFGFDNLVSMLSLEDEDKKARIEAEYRAMTNPDVIAVNQDEVDEIKRLMQKRHADISSEVQDDNEIDFAAMLQARASEDIAEQSTSIDDALAGFEELDKPKAP